MTQTKKNYALPIFMMILLFGMISMVTNLAAPMGVVLMNQFELGAGAGMLGNMANFIAYAVMGIPGGILLQKIGYKKTALLAIAVGFIGLLIQFAAGHVDGQSAFYVYLLGAFVAGFSMTLLNTVVNPMLNTLGGGGNKGNQLIQIGGSFNSVMGTITPMVVGVLIGEVAKASISNIFPLMYAAMGIFAVLFFLLWSVSIPEPHAESASEPIGKLMKGALKFRHFVLGAVGIFVYVGVEVGTPGILMFWLSSLPEYGPATAGVVAGIYWFLMLVGRLIGASIGGKVSSKTMLTAGSALAVVLVLLAIIIPASNQVTIPFVDVAVPINAVLLVLVGLSTSIMWGGIYNLAVEGLGKYIAVASGLFMVMVCGGGILPAVQGWVAEVIGYQLSYFVMLAGFVYLLYYALVGSKNVNKNIPV
ncbi:MAG: MFS transporter [Dysgonamonadaceae bacterium]|jgi:FHS family L-fucose permease-like MFS transporter|nr:MFS transporter [Dysgonamonadaceae bacterium]